MSTNAVVPLWFMLAVDGFVAVCALVLTWVAYGRGQREADAATAEELQDAYTAGWDAHAATAQRFSTIKQGQLEGLPVVPHPDETDPMMRLPNRRR